MAEIVSFHFFLIQVGGNLQIMTFEKYQPQTFKPSKSLQLSRDLVEIFKRRRTIRDYKSDIPDREILENAIEVANSAPSGANKQPWTFMLVGNPNIKTEIRELAEKEEFSFYHERPNKKWIDDLKPLGTTHEKAFLTECPYLIFIFLKHLDKENGEKVGSNYYAKESVGIATGMLISALHLAGLSVLTYTPSRMQFLTKYFARPKEEKPFMVLGVGLPAEDAQVPTLSKKKINEVLSTFY